MTTNIGHRLVRSPRRLGVAVLTGSLLPLAFVAPAAHAAPGVTPVSGAVIVLLNDQHTSLPLAKGPRSARADANRSSQRAVIARAKAAGATQVHGFAAINAFAARLSAGQAALLAADPAVAAIVPDRPLTRPALEKPKAITGKSVTSPKPTSGICPADPSKPLLEPEALQVTHTAYLDPAKPQAQSIATGKGVKVAFLADGLDINNPDFIRADGSHVFTDYKDFSGEGPNAPSSAAEAFGDASSIAAQGRRSYDLSDFVNPAHPLPAGCTITVRGVAPGASLVGLKVFGDAPTAPTSRFIEALDYAVTSGVDVINESFGANPFPDTGDDPITLADNAALAAGITVVASTGDAGTTGTVGSPASSPAGIIGVAATTTFRSYLQTDSAGASSVSNGTWIDNNISGLSSGGVTQSGRVPDLAAPGDLGWALCSPNVTIYKDCTGYDDGPSSIQNFGGTSQASPLTAGAAALVIQAYAGSHGGAKPGPALVKRFLTSTATDLSHPAYEQGAGLLNSLAAVKAARSWHDSSGSPSRSGQGLVLDRSQLSLSGNPGKTETAAIKVTNTSGRAQKIKASTRSFEDVVKTTTGTAALNTATAPAFIDAFGIARSFAVQSFVVGNVDRLDVSAALPSAPAAGRIILIDPTGAFTAYSIPQGAANYAHVDVRLPKAGTWKAYFALSKSSGFSGTVTYAVQQTNFSTHGTVSPASATLKPGQTKAFTVRTPLPTTAGDLSASVQLASSSGVTTSVPLTLRSVIPSGNTTFTGSLTGGNGRGFPAGSSFYTVVVPKGKRDLSLGIKFTDAPATLYGTLTAPDGQVYSFQQNAADRNALQLYVRRPVAGQWHFALAVDNPASGREISQTFVGQVAYDTVQISATLPASRSTPLVAGTPVTVPVKIRNTGVAPLTYYADARLRTEGTIPLVELSGNATFTLPEAPGVTPVWLVPTQVDRLTFQATADQPVNLDVFFQSGNPERYGAANGNAATVRVNADQVSPGIWAGDIGQSGPFAGPATPGKVAVSATARGRLFDPAVTSDGGDPQLTGVGDPAAIVAQRTQLAAKIGASRVATKVSGSVVGKAAAVPALTLRPGQSGVLNVTITPSGKRGTVVKGDLFIDSFDTDLGQGNELVAVPYTYKVS